LQHIYGDTLGFLAAWTWVAAVMPATLAILSIVFVESAYSTAGITGDAGRIEHKLLSILVLIIMSVANTISTKVTTRLNSFFVFMKFASIFAIVVAGLAVIVLHQSNPDRPFGGNDWFSRPWFGYRDSVNPDGTVTYWSSLSSWEMLGHFSAAIYGALWAYSGWDKVSHLFQQPPK
jgi:amino acid transporter